MSRGVKDILVVLDKFSLKDIIKLIIGLMEDHISNGSVLRHKVDWVSVIEKLELINLKVATISMLQSTTTMPSIRPLFGII